MIDNKRKAEKEAQKEKTRKRMRVTVDPENYTYYPEKKQADFYNDDVYQRIGIYVRVSTDDVRQTTSYELQKTYYEDFVLKHPNWELKEIYADEGISGTSRRHRDGFNKMIQDCKNGEMDMIICKSVSRFARNVADCVSIIDDLSMLQKPVGVFFESEAIFTLHEDKSMGLGFHAVLAEEESHTRSRSMETSLRMRLDNGIPLTPKLLGYTHDANGQLVINPDEAPTVKLAFYMYLYGYSTKQIAEAFNAMERKSYLGNTDKWTPGAILQILRNERHCGYVKTRKTYTPNFKTHLSRKNRGERPQSEYRNHHEAIISRDDFIATQKLLDNAKYRNQSILPKLRVIETGVLRGFVTIHPRWSGFGVTDYMEASQSAYSLLSQAEKKIASLASTEEITVEAQEGDFDLRGFEITRAGLLDIARQAAVTVADRKLRFSTTVTKRFGRNNYVELLINPLTKQLAIRPTDPSNRMGIQISNSTHRAFPPRDVPTTAFSNTLFRIFQWNIDYKYRMAGNIYENEDGLACIFDADSSFILINKERVSREMGDSTHPLIQQGIRVHAVPLQWTETFGEDFYIHEKSMSALSQQSEEDWNLRMEGQLCLSGQNLEITKFDVMRRYIKSELGDVLYEKEAPSNERV